MTEESQLLAAVTAAPNDETARLVYADWLKEQGSSQGAFIQGQCRLATLGEAHPEWSTLHAQTERLRRAGEARWVEPLATLLPSREVWATTSRKFRRGFVEHLASPNPAMDWRILSSLVRTTPLRSVAWRPPGESPDDLASALAAAADARLTGAFVLSSGSLRQDAFSAVDAEIASQFQAFGIRSATVHPATVAHLTQLLRPDLVSLVLDHTIIGDAGLLPLAASGLLATVQHLDLRGNQLDREGITALVAKSSDVPIALNLADNEEAIPHVERVLDWRPLRRLDLVGTVDRLAIDAVIRSPAILDLEHLALAPKQPWHFDVDRAHSLAAVPFRRLTRLTLGRCRIEASGMAALAESPSLANLVGFEAFACDLGDRGVQALVESAHVKRLVQLDLNNNGLTDVALEALGSWPGLRNVVRLRLGHNYGITEQGWRILLNATPFDPTELGVVHGLKTGNPGLWAALEERFGSDVLYEDGARWPTPYPSPYPTLDPL
ncbi:MAG: TIGR02996 domain-containing protein [Myxococcota bacterium]